MPRVWERCFAVAVWSSLLDQALPSSAPKTTPYYPRYPPSPLEERCAAAVALCAAWDCAERWHPWLSGAPRRPRVSPPGVCVVSTLAAVATMGDDKPPPPKSRVSRVESYLSTNGFVLTFLGLYILANVILFFFAATPERRLWPVGHYRRNLTPVARGAGNLINFNSAVILLVSARKFMSWLRNTPLNMVVPFDKAMPAFHMLVGRVFLAASVVHVGFHLPVYVVSKPWGPGYNGFTQLFITGSMLVALFAILFVTSVRVNRSKRYELFWYSHAICASLGFVLLMIHGLHYGVYWTYRWAAGPMAVYIIDRLMRRVEQKEVRMEVSRDVGAIKGNSMLCLRLPRSFTYEPGQYAEVKVPAISSVQWHPFTIASAPHEPELVFYIKKSGDWTTNLHAMFASTDPTQVEIKVRGPYGSPAQHVGQFENVVLIGGGVGSTPFASVVKSAHNWMAASSTRGPEMSPSSSFNAAAGQVSVPAATARDTTTAPASASLSARLTMQHSTSAATVTAQARMPTVDSLADMDEDLSSNGSRIPAARLSDDAALRPPQAPSSFTSDVLERRVAELDRLYSIADKEDNDRVFPPPSSVQSVVEQDMTGHAVDMDGEDGALSDDDDSSRLDEEEEDQLQSQQSIGRVLRHSAFINSTAGQQLIGLALDADADVVKQRAAAKEGANRRTSVLGAFFGGLKGGDDRRGTLPSEVVRARTKRVAVLQILHSVSVSLALLWAMVARFAIVALASIMRGFSPSTAGLAMFNTRGLVVADLVLASACAVPLAVSLGCEASILGVSVYFRQRGSLVDTLFLLPLLLAGVITDALALAGHGRSAAWFASVNLLVLWPLLLFALLFRLTRVVGSRLVLAQNLQSSHSLRSLDFVWTSPSPEHDAWLVEELLPISRSGTVRLHRHITRSAAEVEPWMLDYDEVPLKTTYKRPDWAAIFAGITERSRSGSVVGVFFCGPHPMSKSIQDGIARATALSLARGYRRGAIGLDGSGEGDADLESGRGKSWKLARNAYQRSGKTRYTDSYGSNVRFAYREENFL